MINVQKSVPEVYYNQSRDFQFIGRLYEILFNSVKMKADTLVNFPLNDKTDDSYVNLIATTLGFKIKHKYSTKQLMAICSIFSELLRNKGNISAISLAATTLLKADGVTAEFDYMYEDGIINLYVPQEMSDITLLRDVLTYILPAGVRCEITRGERITTDEDESSQTIIGIASSNNVKTTKLFTSNDSDHITIPRMLTEAEQAGQTEEGTNKSLFMNNEVARYESTTTTGDNNNGGNK